MKSSRTSRRDFARMAMAGVAVSTAGKGERRPLEPLSPVAKITLQLQTNFTDEDLQFAKQIGVNYVTVGTTGGTYETFADIKRRVEGAGLKVTNIGNTNVHNMPEVTLNLPGRDQKIEEYKQYLRNLGRAGIYYTTYAHMGNGIWVQRVRRLAAERLHGQSTRRLRRAIGLIQRSSLR
jgi:mannonate dehydratase